MVASILAILHHAYIAPAPVDASVLLPRHRINLSPKPDERFVFLVLAFSVPILACLLMARDPSLDDSRPSGVGRRVNFILPVIAAAFFLGPFVGFDFGQSLVTGHSDPSDHPLRLLAACLFVATAWCSLLGRTGRLPGRVRPIMSVMAWLVFVCAMLLQLFAWRILGEGSISISGTWWNSADAVVYSISQVVGGRTVLADLPSQYGLFAEIVGPIFKVTGLSILKFTALCAVLQVASLSAVFHVVQKLVRDPVLKITFGVALVMITFETCLWFIGIDERYFQYWPIRFFWPSMSVFAFYAYTKRRSASRAAIVSVIGSIGSLWNADSGLMIVISFAAFLVGKWGFLYLKQRTVSVNARRHLLRALVTHIAIFVVIVALMLAYMTAKTDHALHLSWLYEYQRLFYGLGFMMLPMPLRPHPWMPVLAIYLMGMMTAVASWSRAPMGRRADLIFFVSFLGLGLFVYYEGRAHVLNLITVSWPALLLAVVMADRVIRLVKAGQLLAVQLCLPAVVVALLLFCCIPFEQNLGKLSHDAVSNFVTRGTPSDLLVNDELKFIRAHSSKGEMCAILARRQGLYYAATGLISPFTGPGYAEMLTARDRDSFLQQLTEKRIGCVFLGVGSESELELDVNFRAYLQAYAQVAISTKGTLIYMTPR